MIQLGKTQKLRIDRFTSVGAYLSDSITLDGSTAFARETHGNPASLPVTEVLLPSRQLPEGAKENDMVDVFIYKDSEDRPIATRTVPAIQLGQIATLKVTSMTNIGAFLDWGLPKDLLLPFKEQTRELSEGDEVLVALYVDKSSRLCATMQVYEYLPFSTEYKPNDHVQGIVYQLAENFGAFVAVDSRYSALIPKKDLHAALKVGDTVNARISRVLDDGKLELTLREQIKVQLPRDVEHVLQLLKEAGGFLPYHDKSNPEQITAKFNMSKNAFKKAIGHLMKLGHIDILDNGIRLRKL